ncbi:hypothetical protein DXA38_08070 [[Clostridium] innocuum]|uniref:Uncharacterized protein n=1 Tax=Clostridium innocuum TaxID=1522 RepID=A0A3E2VXV9_CLOIN|nr:hypothetical protein DXA38_08070 [[Clostridium] innocuum]
MQSSPFIYTEQTAAAERCIKYILHILYFFTICFSKKHINFPDTFSNDAKKGSFLNEKSLFSVIN